MAENISSTLPTPPNAPRYGFRYALKCYKYYILYTLIWVSLIITLFEIEGRAFKAGTTLTNCKDGFFPLHQADISFTISAVEYLCETIYAWWYVVMAWRIVYILLQTRGTTIREMISITGAWKPSFCFTESGNNFYFSTSVVVIGIIFLGIPARYAAGPLLSGAMSWNSTTVDGPQEYIQTFPVAADTQAYANFATSEAMQRDIVVKCAGVAVNAAPLQDSPLESYPWRPLANMTIPIDSKIQNVTAPYFSLDMNRMSFVEPSDLLIDYIEGSDTNGTTQTDDAADTTSGVLRYSVVGGIFILQEINFNVSNFPTTTSDTSYEFDIGLMMDMISVDTPGETRTNCSSDSKYFSDLRTDFVYEKHWSIKNTSMISCFVQAHVNMQIGKRERMDGNVPSRGIASFGADDQSEKHVQSDPLAPMVLYLLSDVMTMAALTNQTGVRAWNQAEGYVSKFMRLSYYATWSTLNTVFQDPDALPDFTTTRVIPQEPRIMLQLETIFTVLWITTVSFASLSGLAFIIMANYTYREYGVIVSDIQDPVQAALRLDLTPASGDIGSLFTKSRSSKEHERVWLVFKHVNHDKPVEKNGLQVEDWQMLRQVEKEGKSKDGQGSQ